MKTQEKPTAVWICIGMLVIILDSKTAIQGAKESIDLILYTLIPSLFPFFFLSIWLTSTSSSQTDQILKPIACIFRLPENLSNLLLPAFLGGYPSGAQAVTEVWEQGKITKDSAERLLGFCSNAGPSFLFGIIAPMFPEKWAPWVLWLIHVIGASYAAHILPPIVQEPHSISFRKKNLPEILKSTLFVMAQVCGWVILFRILLTFLNHWFLWFFPDFIRVFITGLLELTNGCCILSCISDIRLRFILCAILLSIGGCCVTMQTHSVTKALRMRYYYQGKGIQTLVSACLATALMYPSLVFVALIPVVFLFTQKRYSIPQPSGV